MEEERETITLTLVDACPSFRNDVGSPNWISISAAVGERRGEELDGDEFVPSDGFEFAVEFPDGQIYPVFNRDVFLAEETQQAQQIEEEGDSDEKAVPVSLRRLLIEEREACSRSGSTSSSSSVEDLEGVSPDTYCVWAPGSVPPSPIRTKKSSSTGSSSMRLRLRDLVIGRSHSDGKDKYKLFLAPAEEKQRSPHSGAAEHKKPPPPPPRAAAVGEVKKGKGRTRKVTELDVVTAHRLFYGKPGATGSGANGRRTFLPYRVGFFAASRNGLGHS